jgi:hypothetical protein
MREQDVALGFAYFYVRKFLLDDLQPPYSPRDLFWSVSNLEKVSQECDCRFGRLA